MADGMVEPGSLRFSTNKFGKPKVRNLLLNKMLISGFLNVTDWHRNLLSRLFGRTTTSHIHCASIYPTHRLFLRVLLPSTAR